MQNIGERNLLLEMKMKMKKLFVWLIVCLFAGTVNAGLITVDFPSATSVSTASVGEYFYSTSHSVHEVFTGTGINAVSSLDLALDLDFNNLNSGGFVNFEVFLNSITVGSFSFIESNAFGIYNFNFSFAEIVGSGTYDIALQVTNNVPVGAGSVGFSETNSTAQLTGDISQVSEPAIIALLGLGLVGIGFSRKKKVA
jgi:hypothetical protein